MSDPKRIIILGATGSIGRNALDVVAQHPDKFKVVGLAAGKDATGLAELARKFLPETLALADETQVAALQDQLSSTSIEILGGTSGVEELAARPCDMVISAIVGIAGLRPTAAALKAGRAVAIANKESLVCGGPQLKVLAHEHGSTLIPLDSEHSALFQIWNEGQRGFLESVTITASGGPFRTYSLEQMQDITVEQALKHPNWAMGAKNTIDSATLVNKALEVMEAQVLFDLPPEKIKVLVHPQSIIHGMVSFVDGSTLAQLGVPDMRTAIACAMAWPERVTCGVKGLDLAALGQLTFEEPDTKRFPAVRLVYEIMAAGQSASIVFNAINEVAVAAFLQEKIGFQDITRIIDDGCARLPIEKVSQMEDIFTVDAKARRWATDYINKLT